MAFRGYFALDGVEIANSSRVAAHIGAEIPVSDLGLMTAAADCSMVPIGVGRLLADVPPSSVPIGPGRLLATPPDGSRLYGPGLAVVDDCWTPENLCFACRPHIGYDDSWPGLAELLGHAVYRPELAPWHTVRVPESAEFGGVWVLDVTGLDTAPVQRDITEAAGAGGSAGPHRDTTRRVTFDALLVACSNAGLAYGLRWLTCQLRETTGRNDAVLRYLAAHPANSAADPATLLREVHGVVLTQEPRIVESINAGRGDHHQATMYRVSWELTVLHPYTYSPPVSMPVEWDQVTVDPIEWVHAADCVTPEVCDDMPVLYGEGCELQHIDVVTTPPPSCGGCLPVCAVTTHVFTVPVFDDPLRCRETVTTVRVRNNGARPVTLQAYWRRCHSLDVCDDQLWPVQINALPQRAELTLDGITGRYWVHWRARQRRPQGIVSTPRGVPWRPAVIDRRECWQLVVQSDGDADFDVWLTLTDREA